SPCCGFSFALSGMMMPPAVFSSASMRRTTTRSCRGRNLLFAMGAFLVAAVSGLVDGNFRLGGRLALFVPECQARGREIRRGAARSQDGAGLSADRAYFSYHEI